MNLAEEVASIGWRDLLFVLILALFFTGIFVGASFLVSGFWLAAISLACLVLGLSVCMYVLKKFLIGAFFFLLFSGGSYFVVGLGAQGGEEILAFVLAGLLFEAVYMLVRVISHKVYRGIFIGAVVSVTSLPLIVTALVSWEIVWKFPIGLINLLMVGFLVSLGVSLIWRMIWQFIKNRKWMIKLESKLGSLKIR